MFRKVLIANRGEIAVRILRALRELRIPSVAVYSDADRAALHVRMADEAAHIGPAAATESYLNIGRIIDAARKHGADAIHPGYGFLSEDAEFAAACESAGIVFVGPSPEAIRKMGSKPQGRRLAIAHGVPVVPGTEAPVAGPAEAVRIAREIGFPVLLKAAAGGGGKGMRLVHRPEDLAAALRDAASEAERAFNNAAVYIERAVVRPRHIEIQILGDREGNLVHLGERECSLQRRHQKVIEECPSPLMAIRPELRQQMGEAAIRVARSAGYHNAGTVEFLVDQSGDFYFLEMNTRLQVEHPVTELVTGLDLVHEQFRIAAGDRLRCKQEDIAWRGSAIECRIYAEDPLNHFLPSPGTVKRLNRPSGPGIRLDSGVYPGWTVPLEYDPLLAKLCCWAGNREQAIARTLRALKEYSIEGIQTTIGFFRNILSDSRFREGALHTGFIDEFFSRSNGNSNGRDLPLEAIAALAASLHYRKGTSESAAASGRQFPSNWVVNGRRENLR